MSRIIQPRPGAQLDFAHPLAQGLVGYWLFNEGSGNTLVDYSPYGNHGTLTNMDAATDWVAGENGYALDFDGAGANVVVPHSASTTLGTGDFTIIAGVTERAATTSFPAMIGKGDAGLDEWMLRAGSSGWLNFYGAGGAINVTSAVVFVLGEYTVVAVTRAGALCTLYKNGTVIGKDATSTANLDTTKALTIGGANNAVNRWWNGLIETAAIYNRALTADEVAQLYADAYLALWRPRTRRVFDVAAAAVNAGGSIIGSRIIVVY